MTPQTRMTPRFRSGTDAAGASGALTTVTPTTPGDPRLEDARAPVNAAAWTGALT